VKVRLMTCNLARDFQGRHFGSLAATDLELCSVLKYMVFRDLFQANILDAIKVLKRTSGWKYRKLIQLENQALSGTRRPNISKIKPNLTEEMLGLRG
jgi:hypothetical protein